MLQHDNPQDANKNCLKVQKHLFYITDLINFIG